VTRQEAWGVGCYVWGLMIWGSSLTLIVTGWALESDHVGRVGLFAAAVAAAFTVCMSNRMTRRAEREAFELGRDSAVHRIK